MDVERFLRRSVPRIVARFPRVQKIVLFGSYAAGRPTRDSDVGATEGGVTTTTGWGGLTALRR